MPTRDDNGLLPASWFDRPALTVARELLGQQLCRQTDDGIVRWSITETEAYIGPEDQACHAHIGRTKRTVVMFGPPGHWYVYLCYGVHWLLNIVTGAEGFPAAVLIRGAGEVNGPGRVTKQLAISGAQNTHPAQPPTGLWIARGTDPADAEVVTTPRIGVDYAGDWAHEPFRFVARSALKRAAKANPQPPKPRGSHKRPRP